MGLWWEFYGLLMTFVIGRPLPLWINPPSSWGDTPARKRNGVPGRCSLPGDAYVHPITPFSILNVQFMGIAWGFGGLMGVSPNLGMSVGVWWGFGSGIWNRTRTMPVAAAQIWELHRGLVGIWWWYLRQKKNNAIAAVSSPNLGMAWVWILVGLKGWYFESKKDCFQVVAAAPYECCGVPVGFQWGSCGGLTCWLRMSRGSYGILIAPSRYQKGLSRNCPQAT